VDNSREFSSQCETVLQEVKRAYNFTDREVKHYYFEERDVVVGDIACGEASLATQSAKDLFPLWSPSREEFLTKVYCHTYDTVIEERWRLSIDFVDFEIRENMVAGIDLLCSF